MSKKSWDRRMPTLAPKQPYHYVLPRDLRRVRALAMAQAMECARQVVTQEQSIPEDDLDVMAINSAILHEGMTPPGGQVTNDPLLFRKTFIAAFMEMYPLQREGLRQGVLAAPPADAGERWLFYCRAAENYLDLQAKMVYYS